jgi:hypothetical protein
MSYIYSSGLGTFFSPPEQNNNIDQSIQNVYFSNSQVTVGNSNEYKEKFNVIGKSYTSDQSLVSSVLGPPASFSFYEQSNTGMGLNGSALAFYTNGISKMLIGSNIGINNLNPKYDLDIRGSLLVSSNIYVENQSYNMVNTLSNGFIVLGGAKDALNKTAQVVISGNGSSQGGSLGLISTDNSYINFSKLNSNGLYLEHARFSSNGCLSIGTTGTSATSKILVNGDINASSFSGQTIDYLSNMVIYNSNVNSNYLPLTGGTISGSLNVINGITKFQNSSNAVFIESQIGGYANNVAISFNGYEYGNHFQGFVNPTKSKWSIQVLQSGSSDGMNFNYVTPNSIQSTGNNFLTFSNVGSYASNGTPLIFTGINNITPNFPLDVNGTIKTSSALVINSSTYTDVNLNNTSNTAYFASNLSVYSSNANSNYLPLTGGTISGDFNVVNNSYSKFSTSFTTSNSIFIEPNMGFLIGRMGISFNGRTLPGGNNIFENPGKSKWGMVCNQRNGDDFYFVYSAPNSQINNNFLSFSNAGSYASNGTPLIYTGINNSTPNFPLDVNGIIKTSSGLVINSSTYTDVNLNNTSNTAYFASNALPSKLSVNGGVINGALQSISNISSASGTISTTLCLNYGFFDINNNTTTFNICNEPGNAGSTAFSSFHGGLLNGEDNGSNLSLNRMQLVIRGCTKKSSTILERTEFNIRCFNTQLGWSNITNFKMKDNGLKKGYTTNVSKIFSLPASYSNNEICLGLQKVGSSNDYRCGPVYANLIN